MEEKHTRNEMVEFDNTSVVNTSAINKRQYDHLKSNNGCGLMPEKLQRTSESWLIVVQYKSLASLSWTR